MTAPTPDGDSDLDALNISTVCRRSGLGRSYVYQEIRAGRLIARKFGRLTRVLQEDYEAWLAAAPPILPVPPSARPTNGPNPASQLYPPSAPLKVGDDRPAKPAGAVDLPGIGHNGGPALDLPDGAGRRYVRPGAPR